MRGLWRHRLVLGTAVFAVLLVAAAVLLLWPEAPPTFDAVRAAYKPSNAYLLDRHGQILDAQRVDFGVRRLPWTVLSDVSPALVDAVVAGEDQRFWRHAGVDWLAAAGAMRDAFTRHQRRGASTISMQLAMLLDAGGPTPVGARGVRYKLGQVRLARGLESHWSKQQILEAYLNLLHFRGELQGVGAAAQVLAGKSPAGLSMAESAILAALLPSPGANPDSVAKRACARQRRGAMVVDCTQLKAVAAALLARVSVQQGMERLAPHLAGALLRKPGESVRTTLDSRIQRLARDALSHQLMGLAASNVRDGAAIVVDNATGDVLAYVGSVGLSSRAPAVDGVRAQRQAGSTLKPFLYEMALEQKYLTAASLLDDSPVNIDTSSGVYLPQNYDHEYKGMVSARTALAGSLNVPAVRTLMLVGVEAFRDRLQALGYTGITHDGDYYGYSLALGSAEVSLWEQAQAYRVLAPGGGASPLRILADQPAVKLQHLLPDGPSFIIGDILSDRAARAVTFGMDSSLGTPYWCAVKTGTSKDMRDNWSVGFSSGFTVAVWVGNFEGDAMRSVSGVTGAAPAWREIMDGLQAMRPSSAPVAPAGVQSIPTRFSGRTEPARAEWFLDGTAPRGTVASVRAESRIARISNPANGMVIAVDPDIPADLQRIPFTVQGAATELLLRLNDQAIGRVEGSYLWQPTRGVHRLALEDQTGRVIDRILFTVR